VDGLVHKSEITYEKIPHPSKILKVGEEVEVRVLRIDGPNRKVSLSIKDAAVPRRIGEGEREVRMEAGQILRGIVEDQKPYGLFVRLPQLGTKVRGLLPLEELLETDRSEVKKKLPPGKEIRVEILSIDEGKKIRLSQRTLKEREDREDYEKFIQKEREGGSVGTLADLFKKAKK